MDKRTLFMALLSLLVAVNNSLAQNSSAAYQRIELHIMPSIEIAASSASNSVNLSQGKKQGIKIFNSEQEFRIRSNKNYLVNVTTNETHFAYEGAAKVSPDIPVEKMLYMALSEDITDNISAQEMINGNKIFSRKSKSSEEGQRLAVNYKIKASDKYPAGNYSVGVIYTATEP